MTRLSVFNNPLMLGFDQFERTLDRVAKSSSDGYPPYNIEKLGDGRLRIVLAVAGFDRNQIQVLVDGNQLTVRGKQKDDGSAAPVYLHRGIATRQFQKSFVLADGLEVAGAVLANGLLTVDLYKPEPDNSVRTVPIEVPEAGNGAAVIQADNRQSDH